MKQSKKIPHTRISWEEVNKIIPFKKYKVLNLGGYIVASISFLTFVIVLFSLDQIIEYSYACIAGVLMIAGFTYASKNKNPYENTKNRADKLIKILECPEGADSYPGSRLKLSGVTREPQNLKILGENYIIGGGKEQIDLSIEEAQKLAEILQEKHSPK